MVRTSEVGEWTHVEREVEIRVERKAAQPCFAASMRQAAKSGKDGEITTATPSGRARADEERPFRRVP